MWEEDNYIWVVLCKNSWFHWRQSLFSSHRIPLGEADGVMPPPPLEGRFRVQCDTCGKAYVYRPSDVRRYEQELPENFTPHPLFRLGGERRRSQRALRKVGLVVRGESSEKEAFQEEASAVSVNANGALVILAANVQEGQTVFLKNPRTQIEVKGKVVRIGARQATRAEVGVEFAEPTPDFWPVESLRATKSTIKRRLGIR